MRMPGPWVTAVLLALLVVAVTSGQKQKRPDEDEPEWAREGSKRRDDRKDRPASQTATTKSPKQGYYDETGLRHTESPLGIPLPLDNLLEQVTTRLTDETGSSGDCVAGSSLLELDMCLTPQQKRLFDPVTSQVTPPVSGRRRRQASANGFSLWKNGVIPYIFNATFAAKDRNAIMGAMSEWEKSTCVRFRPANREDRDVIIFRNGRRCSTNIGRIGREQAITLARTCRSKRILIHELGHVIGLIHEHQRHDRDKYVKVLLGNVRNMSQERYQFSKLLSGSITDKSVKYDYTSVMHYGKNYFARRPDLTTLQTSDRRYQDVIGRAEKPSFRDVETVNRLYRCAASCPRSLHCGESCYMDSACVCHCPAGIDKAIFNGPGAYRNQLPDATCEFFALRGECSGNIKDTVRPMCAKSCGLHQLKSFQPEETILNAGAISNQLQPKTALGSTWSRPPPETVATSVNSHNPRQVQNQSPTLQQGGNQYGPNPPYNIASGSQGPPQTEVAPPSVRAPLTPVQNFRAALLQRQAALSSSEPAQYNRGLVARRNSNGRARLMLPSQFNSRSLQRTQFTPRQNNYLQRDSYKSPQHRSRSNYDNNYGRSYSNGVSSWQPWSSAGQSNSQYSRSRSSSQQSYSHQPTPTLRPRTSTRQNRQYGGNIYDMSNYGAPRDNNNGGSDGWLRNGLQNGGFITGTRDPPRTNNRINRYQQNNNADTNTGTWQKTYSSSSSRGHNPTTFADFMNPEYGQVDNNLQRTGPSFMKAASPTNGYRYSTEQSRSNLWDQVQQSRYNRQQNDPPRRPQTYEPKGSSNGYQDQARLWTSGIVASQTFNDNEPYIEPLSFNNNHQSVSIDHFTDAMAMSSQSSPSRYDNRNSPQAFTDPNHGGPPVMTREHKRDLNINRILAFTDPNPGGFADFGTEPKTVYYNKIHREIFPPHHQQPPLQPPPPPPPRSMPGNSVNSGLHSSDAGSMFSLGPRYSLYAHQSHPWSYTYTDRSYRSHSSSSIPTSVLDRTMVFPSHK